MVIPFHIYTIHITNVINYFTSLLLFSFSFVNFESINNQLILKPMKKILLLLCCLFIVGAQMAYSQFTIPNSSFETWDGINPEGWIGLFNSDEFQNVLPSDDAQDGDFSVELKVLYHPLFMNYVRAGLFTENNFPINGRPDMLKGFFKGTSAESDSLTIIVGMFKEGNPIGFGTYFTIQTVSNWTYFMVPIYYTSSENADEAFISFNAGQFLISNEGTSYLIDNIYFEGPSAIEDQNFATEIKIYPNPANKSANLDFALAGHDVLKFDLINMQGKAISLCGEVSYQPGFNRFQANVEKYPNGIYFLRGLGEKTLILHKINIHH